MSDAAAAGDGGKEKDAEKEGLMIMDEGDSDSEEEFDDEGDVDEDDGQFERHVISLPAIDNVNNEDEEEQNARFVDFATLLNSSESGDDDDDNEDEDDNDEDAAAGAAAVGGGGSEVPEEENEIDGVGFVVKQGSGPVVKRSLHSIIESLQTKAGQKALGYDQDDPFLDDEDLDNNPEVDAGLLDIKAKDPYRYDEFHISTDFDVPKDKNRNNGQKKKVLKPLKDLVPPPTEELKAAIDNFREVAKSNQELMKTQAQGKKLFLIPPFLFEPLVRLGKAVEAWHPRRFLVEDIFDYVTDLLPPNTANLKIKTRKLLGPTTPRDAAMANPSALSQQPQPGVMTAAAVVAASAVPIASSSFLNVSQEDGDDDAVIPAVSPKMGPKARGGLATGDGKKVQVDEGRLQAAQEMLTRMIAAQQDYMHHTHPPSEKPPLRFKFDKPLLDALEALRIEAHANGGAKAVNVLNGALVALFPEGFMTSQRIAAKLTSERKKMSGASSKKKQKAETESGAVKPIDVVEDVEDESGEEEDAEGRGHGQSSQRSPPRGRKTA